MTFIVFLNIFWLAVTKIPDYQKEHINIPSGKLMTLHDKTFLKLTDYL